MHSFAISAAQILLTTVILPLWMLAGLADYLCHRATNIEQTSGTRESILHLVQFALVGLPITLALFLDVNAGYFLFAIVFIILHHAVAAVGLVFANPRRHIAPREQMVHSVLEILPITALMLLMVLYWPQLLALFGAGREAALFAPHVRLLRLDFSIGILVAAFFMNLLPYAEELYRCIRYARSLDEKTR